MDIFWNSPTSHDTPGQVNFSLDLLISLKVPKSTRSEDPIFFLVLFSLLCVGNVGNAYPITMPLLDVYLVYMRLNILQHFIIFTENVEKATLFLAETSLYKLFNTKFVVLCKMYNIPRISG